MIRALFFFEALLHHTLCVPNDKLFEHEKHRVPRAERGAFAAKSCFSF